LGNIIPQTTRPCGGQVPGCFPRDVSWFQGPLPEAAIEGKIIAELLRHDPLTKPTACIDAVARRRSPAAGVHEVDAELESAEQHLL
jgi:hypothetical protein